MGTFLVTRLIAEGTGAIGIFKHDVEYWDPYSHNPNAILRVVLCTEHTDIQVQGGVVITSDSVFKTRGEVISLQLEVSPLPSWNVEVIGSEGRIGDIMHNFRIA